MSAAAPSSIQSKTIGQNNSAEVLIGALVVLLAIALAGYLYLHRGAAGSGYDIQARLAKVDGLGVGTDVRISGVKVGNISSLSLDPNNFLVTVHMTIHDDVKIPADSSLTVDSSGILGSQYISINPGGDEKNLPPGGMIDNAQGSIDMNGLIGRFLGGSTSSPPPAPAKPQAKPDPGPSP
jgi:phospholipid/cholesterol/gamma-HCH transport system substrate-binding protein